MYKGTLGNETRAERSWEQVLRAGVVMETISREGKKNDNHFI